MSSFLGAIRSAMGFQTDDGYEYEDDYEYEDERGSYFTGVSDIRSSNVDYYEDRAKHSHSSASKVVNMPKDRNADMKVVVLTPVVYDDARTVCDHLKAWSPVIVKLDRLDKEEAQRVVDFIMGACYTMDGHVQEIKDDVFLVAPSMIGIEKAYDDEDEKTSKTSFFSKFSVR